MIFTAHTNFDRVINSRRMRRAGHVARMGKGVVYTGFWWGSLRERDYLVDAGRDGRTILTLILSTWRIW